MTLSVPPLISVIGPVEPELLAAFTAHYRALGVARFHLAFHFPDHVTADLRQALHAACGNLGIVAEITSTGPWHESVNGALRDELRRRAGDGWHLLADSDELQTYPLGVTAAVARAEAERTGAVRGLMLDRVSSDGSLTGFDPATGLDAAYPLGGFVTHRVVRGDPRKIVLAHSSVPVAAGNHRAPGHRPVNRPPVVVHHFKWRDGVADDVRRRAEHSASGAWQTLGPSRHSEAQRVLAHLERHGGRIGVQALGLRPVTLAAVPEWWAKEAQHIVDTWRPPTRPLG
ncbi:hypothetical protein OU787_17715 [Kitasatospora sp. YST-16]|uniref:hypothetical protein n=1 Tax=Kitasatospora sp. YST-16 TaxID=2998080 RepID=UPI00228342FA|nr:hypothetical protein [Kitasatospora sp. YST-16]WAL73184.1 hypothetical protein OU787_17715 [Kitasatospora sp. YST-16]WNW39237.1 hypothetical protein RKE32_17675 [Streptomyces sp. Li-HN-5-13]